MRRLVVLLLVLMTLLGVQRTTEAQVEGAFALAGVVVTGMIVGGCVHAASMTKPDIQPIAPAMEPAPE